MSSLFSAEPDLVIASLVLAYTIHQVSEGDLFGIGSLCVQKYSIPGNIVAEVLGQTELATVVAFQKTHYSDWILEILREGVLDEYRVAESACMQSLLVELGVGSRIEARKVIFTGHHLPMKPMAVCPKSISLHQYEAPPQKKCNTLVVWLKPLPDLDE